MISTWMSAKPRPNGIAASARGTNTVQVPTDLLVPKSRLVTNRAASKPSADELRAEAILEQNSGTYPRA
jgi:hypothetical protein